MCPDCGTETFEAGRNMRFPRKNASEQTWKKFLGLENPLRVYYKKNNPKGADSIYDIKRHMEIYNNNPVKNWLSEHEQKTELIKERKELEQEKAKARAASRSKLKINVLGLVTIGKGGLIEESPTILTPDREAWVHMKISGGGYEEKTFLYNGKLLKLTTKITETVRTGHFEYTYFGDTEQKTSYRIGNGSLRLSNRLDRQLKGAARKYLT